MDPPDDCAAVDGAASEAPHRLDHVRNEVALHIALKREARPGQSQRCGRDRAPRDARDAGDVSEDAGLVETPEGSEVEDHGPVAASRQTEGDSFFPLRAMPARQGVARLEDRQER